MQVDFEKALGEIDLTRDARKMSNGEYRIRIKDQYGNGYIYTVMPATGAGGWQNSHYHKKHKDITVVKAGKVAFARLTASGLDIQIYREGESYEEVVGQPHNVYMFSGAIIHTIKVEMEKCNPGEKDWHKSDELDSATKPLNENDILSNFGSVGYS